MRLIGQLLWARQADAPRLNRGLLRAGTLTGSLIALLIALGAAPQTASAQNLFSTAIKVNDRGITRYEIDQRARLLRFFRSPGDLRELAREQLIEDQLKLDAAGADGFALSDEQLATGMEEFAARGNLTIDQFYAALAQAEVDRETFREFVRAGLTWREFLRARYANRVTVSEEDLDRALLTISGTPGVRVLLSEIIIPAPPQLAQEAQDTANRISQLTSQAAFEDAARQVSAAPTAPNGGRMNWMPITDLPEALRGLVLSLAPGEVSDPLPLDGAIALFQLRDIQELDLPERRFAEIDYAVYYIDGGRTEENLARARQIDADTDRCDDLYAIAQDQPPEVLERGGKPPSEIPSDIALELAKLDPGEISATLTRANGQTLVVLMLCGRTPEIEGDGPSPEQLTGFIRSRRLDSFADGLLEQLRAEARIVER
ncbi:MAG: peptidylprolyl isomerase [Pseudomonadota bacterium]